MGIRKRGKSWMVDVTVDGRRKTATCRSLAEAQHKEEELRRALVTAEGGIPEAESVKPWTVGEAFETACRTIWRRGTKHERACMKATDKIATHLGKDKMLASVSSLKTLDEVQAWLEVRPQGPLGPDSKVREGLKPASVNFSMIAWGLLLRCAVDRGGLQHMPKMPKHLKVRNGRIRYLTKQEEEAHLAMYTSSLNRRWRLIRQGDSTDHHAWVFIVLIDTGMRMNEFFNLTMKDISLEREEIHIWMTKADLPRTVPMTSRVKHIFETHGCPSTWRPRRKTFEVTFRSVRKALGLEKDIEYVPHALRHTCASRLVQNGVDILYVQKWLGHKDITMTQRYAHLAPDSLKHAVKALEEAA